MAAAPEKARWYHLTPGRLLPLLLAADGFLFLSEQFQWFPFNQHKGWTVLIAVASVGVFLLLMLLWFLAALVFRLRFQFSILSLLVLVVAVALPFSWLATEMKAARKQREAVEQIENLHETFFYDYQLDPSGGLRQVLVTPEPAWLRKLLGDDMFVNVRMVDFPRPRASDVDMKYLKGIAATPEAFPLATARSATPT